MAELRMSVASTALSTADLPLMLKFAERVEPASPGATMTDQEYESNMNYERDPGGPTMRPWQTHTGNGADINTDYHED
ncbi:MAG TPA: hypothetical protein VHB69_02785 [Mycobacteriales bacterium]|nr:hypothetical protein [Mycobacteriales bacterium]